MEYTETMDNIKTHSDYADKNTLQNSLEACIEELSYIILYGPHSIPGFQWFD